MPLPAEPAAADDGATPPGPGLADVGQRIVDLIIAAAGAPGRLPVGLRLRADPADLVRGRLSTLVIDVRAVRMAGLVADRAVIHIEDLTIAPGLPPRVQSGPVGVKVVVTQANVDRWTRAGHVPLRLRLSDEGVLVQAGVAGLHVGEVLANIDVDGALLTLRPVRASMLGLQTPLVGLLRGYLPLPPLPTGARLSRVDPGDGRIDVFFTLPPLDEPISPAIMRRLRRLLLPVPLP